MLNKGMGWGSLKMTAIKPPGKTDDETHCLTREIAPFLLKDLEASWPTQMKAFNHPI